MKTMKYFFVLSLVLCIPLAGHGLQDFTLTQHYVLLATTKTSTMQKELDQAAAVGYRIITGSPTSGEEMMVVMERVTEPPATYQYLLLATSKTSTMQRELDEAAGRGFRLLPQTMMKKENAGFFRNNDEIIVILEKTPTAQKQFQYLLLATKKTSTLEKEILQASLDGYTLVGLARRGEHLAIMEREAKPPPRM